MDKEKVMNVENEESNEAAITKDDVMKADQIRRQYRRSRKALDDRIIENEKYWKLLHNEVSSEINTNKTEEELKKTVRKVQRTNTSAWLFNSVINTHADFMDNFPEPYILPREESDKETAEKLNKIVPVVMKYNNFEKTYNVCAYDKTKSGTSVTSILWKSDLMNGLGDISINEVDILNIDWQPGISDIQDSKNIFITTLCDVEDIKEKYGIEVKGMGRDGDLPTYDSKDYIDESTMVPVVDWYYKVQLRYENVDGLNAIKNVVHHVKYCDGNVLYASENDPKYADTGYYEHGLYPVVFDVLYPDKNSPAGFGKIDIMKNPQQFIDTLNDELLTNVRWNARPRFLRTAGAGINTEDFLDIDKTVIDVEGPVDDEHLKQIEQRPIDSTIFNLMQGKIEELKETSGNRDFSQGSTAAGVTAGSAIAALMEAGSKLSRDAIKNTYTAHNQICYMVIELMRQFYTEARVFRIVNPNEDDGYEFTAFDNSDLKDQEYEINGSIFTRKPIFDVECKSQKASPFSKLSQNELAKEMYGLGFFNPQFADQALAVLEMMEFEGKEQVVSRIAQNGTMFEQIQQMHQQMMEMSEMIAGLTGQQVLPQQPVVGEGLPPLTESGSAMGNINDLGAEQSSDTRLNNTRAMVRDKTEVQ